MGYYTGTGVTSGGGKSTRTLKSFYEWGSFAIRQTTVSETRRLPGVSLSTARSSVQSSDNNDALSAVTGGFGTGAWIIFDAEGTKKIVSYSQIGDSNLYELNITTETLSAYKSNTGSRQIN